MSRMWKRITHFRGLGGGGGNQGETTALLISNISEII